MVAVKFPGSRKLHLNAVSTAWTPQWSCYPRPRHPRFARRAGRRRRYENSDRSCPTGGGISQRMAVLLGSTG
jgi:hypothetical protein